MTSTADILERAAEILDERGWCRGVLENPQGVPANPYDFPPGIRALATDAADWVEDTLGLDWRRLASWNDRQRDKRTVQRALRRAAQKCREAEEAQSGPSV